MTLKQKMTIIGAAMIIVLLTLKIRMWIVDTNKVPKHPFTIINKECAMLDFEMCTYTFIDSTGRSFKMDETSDKFIVGEIIK